MMTEEDSDDEERSTDEVNVLHEHIFRDVFDPGLGARPHYATVFGVAFDPFTDDSFVSSGADGTVRKWDRPDPEKPHVNTHTWTFDKHPHHLVFHGGEKIFAVGGSDGRVYVHSGQDYTTQYYIEGSNPDRQVSSMTWGKASCSSTVFFATEHTGQNQNDGEAYAANYVAGNHKTMYNFSGVPGGGAVMALDGTGSRLAIVAGQRSNMARQSLLVYEPQVLDAQTVLECHLPEFGYITHPPSLSDECHIMDVQFSPCGRYIAIARDNNCALIYDIRNATLPLHVFGHVTYSREEMEHRFGIRGGTQATYGIASLGWMGHDTLITGGSDGCVRRWDTRRATERMGGQVVARLDQPVAHLSFGDDTQQHRYPLIGRYGGQGLCV
ncbi:WD40 repeat-like protein [Dacryopinax primogenitus]|uniref:WD40 repeat-like protein n=1 Tax=Dacryopinax primogenitus (strain DJM 731) TaxID=1858805 RepID=M5G1A1_DACPD|nr:WD40 repeat-like protein [Dacryopinax primogenitus]EJU01965.1 WD40 repeat-like protein [Dacryopinax primogenitus]